MAPGAGGPPEHGTTIYLVRHGRTRLNAAGLLRGHADEPLDRVGLDEAGALGGLFEGVPLRAVVSSPLLRATQTAGPIADAAGLALEVDERMVDRDYGPWTGHRMEELERTWGDAERAPDVERSAAVATRAGSALADIARAAAGGCAALIGHDAVNRLLIAIFCVDVGGDPAALPQRTGCWNRLVAVQGGWSAQIVDARPGDGRVP